MEQSKRPQRAQLDTLPCPDLCTKGQRGLGGQELGVTFVGRLTPGRKMSTPTSVRTRSQAQRGLARGVTPSNKPRQLGGRGAGEGYGTLPDKLQSPA